MNYQNIFGSLPQDRGGGRGLDGKILPVPRIPRKRFLQPPGVLPDSLLIIEVKGRGIGLRDALELLQRNEGLFHRAFTLP